MAGYEYPNNGSQAVALNMDSEFQSFYSPILGKVLLKRLTPEFTARISRLTRDEIGRAANAAGLKVEPWMIDGMLSRIDHFKRGDLGVGKQESFKFDLNPH
jgi:hypothetical protein